MSKIRVCFLGTPEFAVTCLKSLLADEHYEVVGAVTQPDRPSGRKLQLTPSPVKALALEKGLRVVSPESLKDDAAAVAEIQSWTAEIAVVVAFGQLLKQSFMDLFPLGCVNVHASLLPRWRGAAPIQRSIEVGDAETGVCLQRMVKKLDAGDVIGQRVCAIDSEVNSLELHDQLALMANDLLRVELMDFVRGMLVPVPQDEALVTYAKKIEKTESRLDFSAKALDLHNKVRAFAWGPGTFIEDQGKRLKIHKTRVGKASGALKPGQVVEIRPDAIVVATGKGLLEILEVQPESRNRMPVADFLKGRDLKPGDSF